MQLLHISAGSRLINIVWQYFYDFLMSILIHFLTLQIIKTILERGTLRLCIDNISPNDSTGNLRKFSDVTKWGIQCVDN